LTEGTLCTNYAALDIPADTTYYFYPISWDVDSRSARKKLYRPFLNQVLKDIDQLPYCVFDGANLYSSIQLDVSTQAVQLSLGKKEHVIAIAGVKELMLTDPNSYDYPAVMAALNIVFKRALTANPDFTQIGRRMCLKQPQDLPPKVAQHITVLPGYQTEVVVKTFGGGKTAPRLVVNIDPLSKVLSQKSVLTHIEQLVGNRTLHTPAVMKQLRRELIRSTVYTRYNHMSYIVENIDFEKSPLSTFEYAPTKGAKKQPTTYIEYYKVKKEIIRNTSQPLLKTSGRGGQSIYLIPELCLVSDLDPMAKRELPKICSVQPPDRTKRIANLIDVLSSSPCVGVLDNFKMKIEPNLSQVNGKQLAPCKLTMPGLGEFEGSGNWAAKTASLNFKKQGTRPITMWAVFNAADTDFAKMLGGQINSIIAATQSPLQITLRPLKVERGDLVEAIKSKPDLTAANTLLLCIISRASGDYYSAIKQYTLSEGIMSQCVKVPNGELKDGIIPRIAHQILNKFNHLTWWSPLAAAAPSLAGKTILLIGLDVYHAKVNFEEGRNMYSQRRSIGAFVGCAIDANGYRLTCDVIPVQARRELICQNFENANVASSSSVESEDAAGLDLEAPDITQNGQLNAFVKKTCSELKINPHTVIMYRDGVGDSQLPAVKQTEVLQVKQACPNANVIYTVVQKRIHTRFFVKTPNGDVKNPAPGVVVDTDLRSLEYSDFYLISTDCSLSTVKPVRYIILEQSNSLPLRELQQLTYNLCHCYPNWSGPVKLPLPTQMAHKLAFLVGETKVKDPKLHEALFKTCFYL